MPKVSVIIPAYNCDRYIRQAIESVLCQSEQDFEVIVIDDGSTDGTFFIAKSFAKADPRIRVISQPNSGKPSVARNVGIRSSSGEFISFLDADDLYFPRKLEKQLNIFRQYPHINLVFHDVKNLYEDGSDDDGSYLDRANFDVSAKDYVTPVKDKLYLCKPNFYNFMSVYFTCVAIQNLMVRRSCLCSEAIWFSEELTIGEDIDLWFRLALCNRLACLYEPLSYYRRHDDNMTNNMEGYFKGSLEVYETNLRRGYNLFTKSERRDYKRKISGQHFHYGYYLYANFDMKSARREYVSALKLRSTRKIMLALLKTFIPAKVVKSCKNYLRST